MSFLDIFDGNQFIRNKPPKRVLSDRNEKYITTIHNNRFGSDQTSAMVRFDKY